MKTVGHHGLSGPFGGSNEPRSKHTPHFSDFRVLGDPDSDVKNAKFFRGRLSRPCLCIRLAITTCPTHLEGQTSPEASMPLISTIFMCYSTPFFGLPEFRRQKCQIFSWTPSRPFLCIRLAITAFSTHLEGQTSPELSIRLISTIFVCYSTPFFG